ncbi:MAG: PepSY domain-containing protein [Ghiorsea sp.]|nr:PepSY domain-containing protein [Ghiorsea sp.]
MLNISRSKLIKAHRTVAIFSVVVLMFAAISGFLLQHAEDFGWHDKSIEQAWLLDIYDVKEAQKTVYQVLNQSEAYAVQLGHQWYINTQAVAAEDKLKGAVFLHSLWLLVGEHRLYLYTASFAPVEVIDLDLDGAVQAVGLQGNDLILKTHSSTYQADESLISFSRIKASDDVVLSKHAVLPDKYATQLPNRVSDIRYLKVMQDLHGGRLFGLPHWVIPDLTALAILFLSISGLMMRKKRQ